MLTKISTELQNRLAEFKEMQSTKSFDTYYKKVIDCTNHLLNTIQLEINELPP